MIDEIFEVNEGFKPATEYKIKRIPDFKDNNIKLNQSSFRVEGSDISDIDFSNIGEKIKYIRYNTKTKFPDKDKLPNNFSPDKILENAKNPGLGINNLHKKGITGKGITVAIIDQELDIKHQEYKDNLIHYENFGYNKNFKASMHGPAVSSILCGKTVGVAPDAKLVYFSANQLKGQDGEKGIIQNEEITVYFSNYIKALRKILEMNNKLPAKDKISAVSISWGMLNENQECRELIKELKDSDVFVITTDLHKTYGLNFITIDRKMNLNPDNPLSYDIGFWYEYNKNKENTKLLLVPAGGRTIAGPSASDDYTYYGADSGMSWSTPYLAGVYTLAKQVNNNITPEYFWNIALKTGVPLIKNGLIQGQIIQPEKIIETLQKEMTLKLFLEKRNTTLK